MKKILIILLILLSILTACDSNKVEYTVYMQSSSPNNILSDQRDNNIVCKSTEGKDFHLADRTNVVNELAPKERIIEINGQKISATLTKSFNTAISTCNNNFFSNCGKFDQYDTSDSSMTAEYRQNTDTLLFILFYDMDYTESGDLTEEEANEIAYNFIVSNYGETVLKKYTYYITYHSAGLYIVTFRRFVYGYKADDIRICITSNGDIYSVNASNLNLFDNAEKDISKKSIEAAEKVLIDTVHKSWDLEEPELFIDSTGTYYLSVTAWRDSTSSFSGTDNATFYININ